MWMRRRTPTLGPEPLRVIRTVHADRFQPDTHDADLASYEYQLFSFSMGDATLVARRYEHDPQQAHFLRHEKDSVSAGLTARDVRTPLFVAAVAYLRGVGVTRIKWLNVEGRYEPVPGQV